MYVIAASYETHKAHIANKAAIKANSIALAKAISALKAATAK